MDDLLREIAAEKERVDATLSALEKRSVAKEERL